MNRPNKVSATSSESDEVCKFVARSIDFSVLAEENSSAEQGMTMLIKFFDQCQQKNESI